MKIQIYKRRALYFCGNRRGNTLRCYLVWSKREPAKASTDNASAYQQFIQNRPDLAEIVLDNAKDDLYFNKAVSLFGLDLSVIKSRFPQLHYHVNQKIPYYALQIIRHSKASANQNQAVDKLLEFLLELAAKHDDFWDTTYFQKSLCLVYSMLLSTLREKATCFN